MFISLYHTVPVNARGSITESRNCVKSLGIYTDSNFAFGNHLNRICCKASQKLHALSRFVKYISDEKRMFRSSYQKCSIKKGVLRNFAKFTGKYLCQSLFFNKIAGLGPATLLKKRLWHRCFPVNFAKFLRTPFLQNTSGHSHKKRKIVWKHGPYCWYFRLNLKYLGWPCRAYIKTAKNGDFC